MVTVAQCHRGEHTNVLEKRKEVYEAARASHPEHWMRDTKNWNPREQVALNPMCEKK
ncbi:hypothetical protein [Sporosarcina sp. PTS2304]|uniref:hypothetical protein n=1 Tax=Sporosarcina sp. PTS2304 TaxID=2283194 RepID=UPI0013B3DCE9|nr:hypothetical protein [Sporosarcina sp. PTS2304]